MDWTLILLGVIGILSLCWVALHGDDAGEYEERGSRWVRTSRELPWPSPGQPAWPETETENEHERLDDGPR